MSQHVLNDSSQSSPNVSPSAPPTALVPSPADFNILASMFQDMAQVLLKYGISASCASVEGEQKELGEQSEHLAQSEQGEPLEQSEQPSAQDEPSAKEQVVTFSYNTEGKTTPEYHKIHIDALEQYRQGEFHEEIRCFHLPESNVRKEHALLKKHDCVHLAEFLYRTHADLSMFVNLLSYVDTSIELPADVLQHACYKMELLLENLEELHKYLENYEQIHKELVHTAVIPA